MARGRKPRNWIKIDCEGILRGSINYLLPLDGQAIWIKMIAYSEVCGGAAVHVLACVFVFAEARNEGGAAAGARGRARN